TGSADKVVRLWNNGVVEKQFPGHEAAVTAVAVTNEAIFSAGTGGTIRAWTATSGQSAGVIPGHDKPGARLAVSADGKPLASADQSGTVKVWKLPIAAPKAPAKIAPVLTHSVKGALVSLEPVAGQPVFRFVTTTGEGATLDPASGKAGSSANPLLNPLTA